MADGDHDADVAEERESSEVELEAKRTADGSWHPCRVSRCPGRGLSVKFEGQDAEDIIFDVEDALARLRVRSVPLQGDDCCYIEEGKNVLASCGQNSERLFFDAVVQKTMRVRHSKRSACRCTFLIKWLFRYTENETLIVPSGSIMKLAAGNINSHPVISAFLNTKEESYFSTQSSSYGVLHDTEGEIDLHGLLKQMEHIGSLTDVSKKEHLKDTLIGVDHGGRERNCLRRSSRNHDKTKKPMEYLITSAPSPIQEAVENRSPLNPLAARAVLASLVSKLPEPFESDHQKDPSCVSNMNYTTLMHVSGDFGSHFENNVKVECVKGVDTLESLVTAEMESSGKKLQAQKSFRALVMEVCHKNELCIDSSFSISSSVSDEESIQPGGAGRLNRSATKRKSENLNGEVQTRTLAKDTTFVRLTRSATHKGKGDLVNDNKKAFQEKPVRETRSTYSIEGESEVLDGENRSRPLDEEPKFTVLSSRKRLTRSSAREGTVNLNDQVKEVSQAKLGNKCAQPLCAQKSESVVDSMVSTKKRTFSQDNAELKLPEDDKKQKRTNAVDGDQHSAVEGWSRLDNQSLNRSRSSKFQSSRPRTRSQSTS